MTPKSKEYEIPDSAKKESTNYWLDVWEGWLERAAINLEWRPSTRPYSYEKNELVAILAEFRREVLIHLKQVVFLREKRRKARKMRKQRFDELREEFLDLYRYGQSRSIRTKREIWSDVEELLIKVGLNKGERLAVCNEFLEQARTTKKEADDEK